MSGAGDEQTEEEEDKLEAEQAKKRLIARENRKDREHEARVQGVEQDQRDRKLYTRVIFVLMVAWLLLVLLIVVASGMKKPEPGAPALPIPGLDLIAVSGLLTLLVLGALRLRKPKKRAKADDDDRNKAEKAWGWVNSIVWLVLPVVAIVLVVVRSATMPPTGLGGWLIAFELTEGVMLMLLGTTTANVVGLFYIVARYLFPRQGKGERKPDDK